MPEKQKMGLFILTTLLLFSLFIGPPGLKYLIGGMGLPLFTMSLGPFIYDKVGLPVRFRYIPLLVSMILPLVIIGEPLKWLSTDMNHYYFVSGAALLLLVSRIKIITEVIRVAFIIQPITTRIYLEQLTKMISLILCEELLFRVFFFHFFLNPGLKEIILGAIIFTYYHYFNRFSSSLHTTIDYLYLFLLAFILGTSIVYFDQALLPLLIGHMIYNSTNFISLSIQRFRANDAY